MNLYEIGFLRFLREISNSFLDFLFQAITFFGEQYCLIVLIAFFMFVINKEKGQRIAYSVFLSLCLNGALKSLVERVRPFKVDTSLSSIRKETATGFSFPSGHTQNAAVSYLSCALVIKKRWAYIASSILIILIGFSRLWLGVHYPTDVLVGLLLGVGCAFLGAYLHSKVEHDFAKKMKLYIISLLVFLPFILIFPFVKEFGTLAYSSDGIEIVLKDYRDFYISYAMFAGYILSVYLENKYVNYDCNTTLKIRLVRFFVGLAFIAVFYFGLKLVFEAFCEAIGMEQTLLMMILDMVRYFLVPLFGLGLYPIIMKKVLFKKEPKVDPVCE